MKTLIMFLLILSLASYIVFISGRNDYLTGTGYDVYVINGFKNNSSLPLVIWCSSQENDIGGRALQEGDDFSWSLKTSLWGTTFYSCTMKWDQMRKRFDAFHHHRDSRRSNGPCELVGFFMF
ncbi:hypothetical protein Acr_00g0078580 [Actinidia rufa]|uniref:S-protein homolog n=1 Tax=Actinidia rufa TaxID=165716 RepID=A0A7J0DU62_9ERIC|nr:hypothetical protein Acr_00g0078580 [Actinidia rufa]